MGSFIIVLLFFVSFVLFPLALLGSLKRMLDKQNKQDETK